MDTMYGTDCEGAWIDFGGKIFQKVTAVIQSRDDGRIDQNGQSGGEKLSDSGCILDPDGVFEREVKDDSKVLTRVTVQMKFHY